MTIVRVGTNQKYAEGWEQAFGDAPKKKAAAGKGDAAKKSAKKKTAKKKTSKK